MWRVSAAMRMAASATSSAVRPYRRVLRAMEQEGKGLLVAAEVFKDFKTVYHESVAAATQGSSTQLKPLTLYCGAAHELEPLTIILLKVLCDLRRMEEMRFLFTQCLLELDDKVTPSAELFNVYLLAISMTDSFNQYEVDNIAEVMRCKGTEPDVVTKLSMFLLYLRLGQDSCMSWWPMIRADIQAAIDAGATSRYPLLPLRLQHCFQTLTRLHHDADILKDCYDLLCLVNPSSCTPALLLPYMLLAVSNAASPPSHVMEVLARMESAQHEATRHSSDDEGGDGEGGSGSTAEEKKGPLLSSEVTVFRLLAKCAKWGDVDSARLLRAYVKHHDGILQPENIPVAALLYVEALVKGESSLDHVTEALQVVETELTAPLQVPLGRPKVFLESRRITLLASDPVQNLVYKVASLMRSEAGGVLEMLHRQHNEGAVVTPASLNVVLSSCAVVGDALSAQRIMHAFPDFGATPNAYSYAMVLRCFAQKDAAEQYAGLRREMAGAGIAPDATFLRAAMEVVLSARDMNSALSLLEELAACQTPMDNRMGAALLRQLSLVADAAVVRRALLALQASKTIIDHRMLRQSVGALQRFDPEGAAQLMREFQN